MVMGGLALSVWGRVRATQDVDVSLSIDPAKESALTEALLAADFLPSAPRAIRGHRLVTCRYLKSSRGMPVQVDFLLARGAYQHQSLHRASTVTMGRRRLRVIAPEDLILHKLLASRPLDLLDVQAVVEEQAGRLDWPYLRRWAKALGLTRQLRSIRAGPEVGFLIFPT